VRAATGELGALPHPWMSRQVVRRCRVQSACSPAQPSPAQPSRPHHAPGSGMNSTTGGRCAKNLRPRLMSSQGSASPHRMLTGTWGGGRRWGGQRGGAAREGSGGQGLSHAIPAGTCGRMHTRSGWPTHAGHVCMSAPTARLRAAVPWPHKRTTDSCPPHSWARQRTGHAAMRSSGSGPEEYETKSRNTSTAPGCRPGLSTASMSSSVTWSFCPYAWDSTLRTACGVAWAEAGQGLGHEPAAGLPLHAARARWGTSTGALVGARDPPQLVGPHDWLPCHLPAPVTFLAMHALRTCGCAAALKKKRKDYASSDRYRIADSTAGISCMHCAPAAARQR